jgi:hypothetical protein
MSSLDSSLDLEHFYQTLLFASDRVWTQQIDRARSEIDTILSNESSYLPICYGIYDAVQLCTDLLAWQTGLPLGNADPWGVSSEPLLRHDPGLRLVHLAKFDERTPERIRKAALLARDPEQVAPLPTTELLQEALLLKVLHFAQLSRPSEEHVINTRTQIVKTLSPPDETVLVERLGPRFAWASVLWRTAPTDERSLIRASESAAVMSEALTILEANGH